MYTGSASADEEVPPEGSGVAAALLRGVAAMDDDALTVRARELAGEISAAEANLAAVLAELERREVHSAWECTTIERFAGWHLQQAPARARSLAQVGRAMASLPAMAEAVAGGTLGFDKARSIARVAAPDTEGALVELALHATTAQTQRICGAWRKVDRTDGTEAEEPGDPRPTVVVVRDDDGIELTVRFDHVRGELVLASIDAEARAERTARAEAPTSDAGAAPDPHLTPACEEDRAAEALSTGEWRALGLLRLAERSAAEVPESLQRSGFDTTVVVHVGIDTLYGPDLPDPADRSARPARDEMAQLEPAGVQVRRDVARWLACDAGLLTVVEDADGNPLHLGRRTNPVTPALRRAVHARHRTCTWPGCVATAVQVHHVHHRAHGGHDDVENLVPECFEHHRRVHLDGISITRDPDGRVHHWRPDGTEVLARPPSGAPATDAAHAPDRLRQHRLRLGAEPGATERQPAWQGDPLHLGDCIEAVLTRREQALRRTRPTAGARPDAVARAG